MRITTILLILLMTFIFSICTGQPTFDASLISNSTESTESLFIIDGNLYRAWPLCTGDLDGDGDNDIVAASGIEGNNEVKWYGNNLFVSVNKWDEQFSPNTLVDVTPNPVKDFLHITWSNPQIVIKKIDLYSGSYKKLKNLFSNGDFLSQREISIGIPELSKGLYMVKIITNSGVICKKIILR